MSLQGSQEHSGQEGVTPRELFGAAPLQKQRQVEAAVLEGEMTYNEALIEEREQGITEIAQQIGEVNEIFQARAWPCGGSGGDCVVTVCVCHCFAMCLLNVEQAVHAWLLALSAWVPRIQGMHASGTWRGLSAQWESVVLAARVCQYRRDAG